MGFFDRRNATPIQKEIEIEYDGEAQKLLNTFKEAGLVGTLKGENTIKVGLYLGGWKGLFKSMKGASVVGELIRVENTWSGTIIIEGPQADVTEMYTKLRAYFKAFCK